MLWLLFFEKNKEKVLTFADKENIARTGRKENDTAEKERQKERHTERKKERKKERQKKENIKKKKDRKKERKKKKE